MLPPHAVLLSPSQPRSHASSGYCADSAERDCAHQHSLVDVKSDLYNVVCTKRKERRWREDRVVIEKQGENTGRKAKGERQKKA